MSKFSLCDLRVGDEVILTIGDRPYNKNRNTLQKVKRISYGEIIIGNGLIFCNRTGKCIDFCLNSSDRSNLHIYPANKHNLEKIEYRKVLERVNHIDFNKLPIETLRKIEAIVNEPEGE